MTEGIAIFFDLLRLRRVEAGPARLYDSLGFRPYRGVSNCTHIRECQGGVTECVAWSSSWCPRNYASMRLVVADPGIVQVVRAFILTGRAGWRVDTSAAHRSHQGGIARRERLPAPQRPGRISGTSFLSRRATPRSCRHRARLYTPFSCSGAALFVLDPHSANLSARPLLNRAGLPIRDVARDVDAFDLGISGGSAPGSLLELVRDVHLLRAAFVFGLSRTILTLASRALH